MLELYEKVWDEQIGYNEAVGFDFSGREIHKEDFGNPISKFGWTLLPFSGENNDNYLVVHNKTMEEFPEEIGGEFYINGKIFEVNESLAKRGVWDINQVSYETIETQISNKEDKNLKRILEEEKLKNDLKLAKQDKEIEELRKQFEKTKLNEDEQKLKIKEIEKLRLQMQQMRLEHQKELKTLQIKLSNNSIDESYLLKNLNKKFVEQTQELENLKEYQKKQEEKILELEQTSKLNLTKEFELNNKIENFKKQIQPEIKENNNNDSFDLLIRKLNGKIVEQTQELENLKEYQKKQEEKILELEQTSKLNLNREFEFKSSITEEKEIEKLKLQMQQIELNNQRELRTMQLQLNNELLLTKLEEQKEELKNLKEHQKQQEEKFLELEKTASLNLDKKKDFNKDKDEEEFFENEYDYETSKKTDFDSFLIWEKQFGDRVFVSDFAGLPMIKSKYRKNVVGGWGIDYYDSERSDEVYIASLSSIEQRNGKLDFSVGDKNYKIINENTKWIIIDKSDPAYKIRYKTIMDDEIRKFDPENVRTDSDNYEYYSSLLINLNHFPLEYLKNFEIFLKNLISGLSIYKKMYIYLNKNSYEKEKSNVTSYARIFFKSSSIKDDIEILFTALKLKNAMIHFTNNHRSKNHKYIISFSMVLANHKRNFKFIQAQTNFDILKINPVPLKIPVDKLVLDSEYNSILKYHENNLWKKLRPLALDYHGNTYYICDIDPDDYWAKKHF